MAKLPKFVRLSRKRSFVIDEIQFAYADSTRSVTCFNAAIVFEFVKKRRFVNGIRNANASRNNKTIPRQMEYRMEIRNRTVCCKN